MVLYFGVYLQSLNNTHGIVVTIVSQPHLHANDPLVLHDVRGLLGNMRHNLAPKSMDH